MNGKVAEKIANTALIATKAEKLVIKGLMKLDCNDLIYMSIIELGLKLDASESTILRLCKKLGYRGFREFKLAVSQDVVSLPLNIGEETPAAELLKKIVYALNVTLENANQDDIDEVARRIIKARKVCVFGVGNSYVSTVFFSDALIKVGINAYICPDSHLQTIVSTNLTEEDVVIIMSVSGTTIDMIQAAQISQDNHAYVVIVTNYSNSPLTKYASTLLISSTTVSAYEGELSYSIISQIYLLDLIYQSIIKSMESEEKEKAVKGSKRVLNK